MNGNSESTDLEVDSLEKNDGEHQTEIPDISGVEVVVKNEDDATVKIEVVETNEIDSVEKSTNIMALDLENMQIDHSQVLEEDTSSSPESSPSDDVQSAVDIACQLMREGREVQKISVVRNLPDLLLAHPQQCLSKVIPIVQESLVETSSLDLHCEGAIAYRNILNAHDLSLSLPVLSAIIDNLETPHDSLAGAAWFETLLDVIDQLPLETVRSQVLPVLQHQIQQSKPVQRKVATTKLIHKLATKLSTHEVKTELISCVQALSQDLSAHVRSAMCEKLPEIAKTLNPVDCEALVLPSLVELCNDEDTVVRQTTFDALAHIVPYFSPVIQREYLVPLMEKCAERSLQAADTTLPTVAKQLGPWFNACSGAITSEQSAWFLSFFCRLACLCRAEALEMHTRMSRSDPEGFSLNQSFESDPISTACRHWAAYNFPGILIIFGGDKFEKQLGDAFHALCTDPDEAIRRTMAAGFHEVTQVFSRRGMNALCLLRSFTELIRAGDADVVLRLTSHLHTVLPVLYSAIVPPHPEDKNREMLELETVNHRNQLNRIVLACNRLVRGTSNWRGHESLLSQLSCLTNCLDVDDLLCSFIPMLKEEILSARAIPCRLAAVHTFLIFMRQTVSRFQRHKMIDYLIQTLCFHQSCHKRTLYLDACFQILQLFSKHFFVKYFLTDTLKLCDDRVPAVRHKLCKLLPKIKQILSLPEEDIHLVALEKAMRTMINKQQTLTQRNTTQNAAMILSQTDTTSNIRLEDERKLEDEMEKFGSPPRTLKTTIQLQQSVPKLASPTVKSHASSSLPLSPARLPKQTTQTSLPPQNLQKTKSSSPSKYNSSSPKENEANNGNVKSVTDVRPPMIQGTNMRIHRPVRTAVVRPQPKALVSRSPSPRPNIHNAKDKSNGSGDRMSLSADHIDEKEMRRDRSTLLRPPTPVRRKSNNEQHNNSSSRSGTLERNGNVERSASTSRVTKPVTPVKDSIERWQHRGESPANPNIVLMKRSLEKRYYGPSAVVHDSNNNSNKTGIPLSTSTSSSSIFSRGAGISRTSQRSSANYGLMKINSASALNSRHKVSSSFSTSRRLY